MVCSKETRAFFSVYVCMYVFINYVPGRPSSAWVKIMETSFSKNET